jgi:glycosyltransferase involved in cell wall biosynthesis
MRVVHVHRIAGIGGSERHLLTLLPALAERGVEPAFVGLDLAGADPFYEHLAARGIPFARTATAFGLLRAVRRSKPDLLHTHLVHADAYGALAPGVPAVVSTKHNPDPFRVGPFRYVERALTHRARRVIAISDAVRRFNVERVGLPADKISVVHYGLDALPERWAASPPLPLSERTRVLLLVGRLAEQKGVDVAIRALPAIRRDHPDAMLLVLGEGPQRGELEALARSLGVADVVAMPGRIGDVAEFYRRAELLVHPVRWEGFGLALVEAMLAARAVVATAVASAPELVQDGRTGLLVPPDDPPALAAAVSSLLGDASRAAALGAAGRERALAEFSVGRMADATVGVYRSALAE